MKTISPAGRVIGKPGKASSRTQWPLGAVSLTAVTQEPETSTHRAFTGPRQCEVRPGSDWVQRHGECSCPDMQGTAPCTQASLSPSAAHLGLTSNLGIVCNPYNAVGVVGRGGDFSCTASAVSAGRREGNQDPKLGTLRSSLNPPHNCWASREPPWQDPPARRAIVPKLGDTEAIPHSSLSLLGHPCAPQAALQM